MRSWRKKQHQWSVETLALPARMLLLVPHRWAVDVWVGIQRKSLLQPHREECFVLAHSGTELMTFGIFLDKQMYCGKSALAECVLNTESLRDCLCWSHFSLFRASPWVFFVLTDVEPSGVCDDKYATSKLYIFLTQHRGMSSPLLVLLKYDGDIWLMYIILLEREGLKDCNVQCIAWSCVILKCNLDSYWFQRLQTCKSWKWNLQPWLKTSVVTTAIGIGELKVVHSGSSSLLTFMICSCLY